MKFDPSSTLKILHEFAIEYERKKTFEEASAEGALAGYGTGLLGSGLECLLVGLFDVGAELLTKAQQFLRGAADQLVADPARSGALSNCLVDLVQCEWFCDKRHDAESAKQAVRSREEWFVGHCESSPTDVQLTLPAYLDAEEYDALFARFDAAGLKKPKNLRNIKGQGTMAYVVARHRLGLEYSPDEVAAALHTFFKRNVGPTWLDFGHQTTVALWMKIAFWKPGDDPIATLLKCYGYLQGLQRPEYNAE